MIIVLLGIKFSLVGSAGTLRLDCIILGDLSYYYYCYIISTILTSTFISLKVLLYSISYYLFSKCFLILLFVCCYVPGVSV
jgi:hypothetical protein